MTRIVVIVGHVRTATYCEALGQSYARGARSGGHDVKLFLISRMTFDPILHEGFERVQPLEQGSGRRELSDRSGQSVI
jgi:NAD(P)H dehydrogenase (quinone)